MSKLIIRIAVVLGLIAGSVFLMIGFQHNLQGEFFEQLTGTIDFDYAFLIFTSWFLVVTICSAVLLFILFNIINLLKKFLT